MLIPRMTPSDEQWFSRLFQGFPFRKFSIRLIYSRIFKISFRTWLLISGWWTLKFALKYLHGNSFLFDAMGWLVGVKVTRWSVDQSPEFDLKMIYFICNRKLSFEYLLSFPKQWFEKKKSQKTPAHLAQTPSPSLSRALSIHSLVTFSILCLVNSAIHPLRVCVCVNWLN